MGEFTDEIDAAANKVAGTVEQDIGTPTGAVQDQSDTREHQPRTVRQQ